MHEMIIGCDNAAVSLKNSLKQLLADKGIPVEDVGAFSNEDSTAYPLIAETVCEKVARSGYQKRGMLVCGTGLGMCITANKCKGIRAAVCHDIYSARRSVLSNDCNVICFGERVIGVELAKAILEDWITLEFKDGSSTPKVNEIKNVEARNFRD